jgi:hypothetical protein
MPSHNKVSLEVVVGGNPTTVDANTNAPLNSIVGKALQQTGNQGDPHRWEFRDAKGNLIDGERKIEDLELTDGSRLFLNLKAGVAG